MCFQCSVIFGRSFIARVLVHVIVTMIPWVSRVQSVVSLALNSRQVLVEVDSITIPPSSALINRLTGALRIPGSPGPALARFHM